MEYKLTEEQVREVLVQSTLQNLKDDLDHGHTADIIRLLSHLSNDQLRDYTWEVDY